MAHDVEGSERRASLVDLERRLERFMDADSARWATLTYSLDERKRVDDQRHKENTRKIDCLTKECRDFMEDNKSALAELKATNLLWAGVRKSVLEKGVLGMIGLLVVILGMGAIAFLKSKLF